MAAKSAQENIERRFKSVSEYLENGNPKKALQELEKIVKKTNDESSFGLAFRALCLIRLSRADEAEPLLQQLCSDDGEMKDENTLQLLQFCFREIHREDRITAIYENMSKKQPQNEELLNTLFNCNVRQMNFKRTKEVAMLLAKLNQARVHYSFNVAASLVMQAETARRDAAERAQHVRLTYPLAIRMLEKYMGELQQRRAAQGERFFKERTSTDSDLVGLYIIALEKAEHYGEAQEALEQYKAFFDQDPVFYWAKMVELLRRAGRWAKLFTFCDLGLDQDRQSWLFYEGYVSAAIELIKNPAALVDEEMKKKVTLSNVLDRLDGISAESTRIAANGQLSETEKQGSCDARRAALLVFLELAARVRDHNLQEQFEAALANRKKAQKLQEFLTDAAFEYFESFSTKPCCFEDLVVYLKHLDSSYRELLAKRCQELVQKGDSVSSATHSALQTKLSLQQLLKALLSEPLQKADVTARALELYTEGLLSGRELPLTELQFADSAMLVATVHLDELIRASGDRKLRDTLLLLLSGSLQRSPHNHFSKLCLVRLFSNQLNAAQVSHRLADSMSIKNVQMGSMAHYVLYDLYRCGLPASAAAFNTQLLKFYSSGARDCGEYLINAFRACQYFQLEDIVRYRLHLSRSLEFAIGKLDACLFKLMEADDYKQIGSALATVKTEELDELVKQTSKNDADDSFTDLRDLAVFTPLRHDAREYVANGRRETFKDEQAYLRFRALELSVLKNLDCDAPQTTAVNTLAGNLNELLNSMRAAKALEAAEKDLYLPCRTVLTQFAQLDLAAFWNSLVAFACLKLAPADPANANGVDSHLNSVLSWFDARLKTAAQHFDSLKSGDTPQFETLVLLVHALGCLTVTFSIIRHRTRSSTATTINQAADVQSKMTDLSVSGSGKKNKKKQAASAADAGRETQAACSSTNCALSKDQLACVAQLCTKLGSLLRSASEHVNGSTFSVITINASEISESNADPAFKPYASTLEAVRKSGKLYWNVSESRLVEAAAAIGTETPSFDKLEAFGKYLVDGVSAAVRTSYSESFKQLRAVVDKFSKLAACEHS